MVLYKPACRAENILPPIGSYGFYQYESGCFVIKQELLKRLKDCIYDNTNGYTEYECQARNHENLFAYINKEICLKNRKDMTDGD